MTSSQYPLQVPDDLMAEVESTAKSVHLSKADVMRQSIKLGLSKLREQLSARSGRITNVDPLPGRVLAKLYREREDDDVSIRRFIAAQPKAAE
jgi:hypothetical protein